VARGFSLDAICIVERPQDERPLEPHQSVAKIDVRWELSCHLLDRELTLHCCRRLSNGLELGVPVDLAQGLAGAKPAALAAIEISATGLGLHWPKLDADLYLPALMEGIFGTRRWMARVMGKAGGRSTSSVKQAAARENGRLGGRPRKVAV